MSGLGTFGDHANRWVDTFLYSIGFGFLLYKAFEGYVGDAKSGQKNTFWILALLAVGATAAFVYYLMEFLDIFNNIPEDEAQAQKEDVVHIMYMSGMFFVLFYAMQNSDYWAPVVKNDWVYSLLIGGMTIWYVVMDTFTCIKGKEEVEDPHTRIPMQFFMSAVIYILVVLYVVQPHQLPAWLTWVKWEGADGGKVANQEDFGSSYEI